MMGYKDQTWCSRYNNGCVNSLCHRALTKEEQRLGKRWWGSEDFPVLVGDRKSDTCGFISGIE